MRNQVLFIKKGERKKANEEPQKHLIHMKKRKKNGYSAGELETAGGGGGQGDIRGEGETRFPRAEKKKVASISGETKGIPRKQHRQKQGNRKKHVSNIRKNRGAPNESANPLLCTHEGATTS